MGLAPDHQMLQADGQGGERRLLVASEGLQENQSREPAGSARLPSSAPAPEALAGMEPGASASRRGFQTPTTTPRTLSEELRQGVRLGQQASFCPQKLLGFLLRTIFWNRPGYLCFLIQKVWGNVIHLQIKFSASGWVRNREEPPRGA